MTKDNVSTISDSASTAKSLGTWLASVNSDEHSPRNSVSRETTSASRVEAPYWRNNRNLEDIEEKEEQQEGCNGG
jgi:hypothetical protein